MADAQEVWWRAGGHSPFALDPTKPFWPQVASGIGQGLVIFGGPVVGIVAINYYPFLIQDHTIYIGGISGVVFWFLASFAIFSKNDFPRGIPGLSKLEFRAGFGLWIQSWSSTRHVQSTIVLRSPSPQSTLHSRSLMACLTTLTCTL
jgi:hypothetical protein